MLLYRVLSALVGAPVFLMIFWYGQLPLALLVSLLIIFGTRELAKMVQATNHNLSLGISLAGSLLLLVMAYLNKDAGLGLILSLIILAVLINLLWKYPGFSLNDAGLTLFSIIYIGWLMTHLYLVRTLPNGTHFSFMVLLTTWAIDTGAYFTGRSLGKRKLAPKLSPQKTVEGALGGVAAAVVVAGIFSFWGDASGINYIILGILLGIISQIGDLIESGIKRLVGVKDSGNLIPGHGGVLDRFDSLLLTAPLVYYYVQAFIIS